MSLAFGIDCRTTMLVGRRYWWTRGWVHRIDLVHGPGILSFGEESTNVRHLLTLYSSVADEMVVIPT